MTNTELREKLVEIIRNTGLIFEGSGIELLRPSVKQKMVNAIADSLIANGVNFATDTNDGGKWISVKHEKPKRRGSYFIAYKFKGSDMRFYGEAMWHDDIPDNGFVKGDHFSNEGMNGMYVTHWMEIPQPPKEE